MATHSSSVAWRIPWKEEPGKLSARGREESDTTERLTHTHTHTHTHTPLTMCRPWGLTSMEKRSPLSTHIVNIELRCDLDFVTFNQQLADPPSRQKTNPSWRKKNDTRELPALI